MASYGAKYLQWAKFKEAAADESAEAWPKYDSPVNLGPLVAVTDNLTFAEAKNHGDNALKQYASEFQELAVDAEVTDLPNEVAAAIFGATITEAQDTEYGDDDQAPYGGLAFYINKMDKSGKQFFQGIYYPKLKASRQGATYNTKGQSVSFTNDKVHFVGMASAKGKYQDKSKDFTTETEAKAWVDNLIKASV